MTSPTYTVLAALLVACSSRAVHDVPPPPAEPEAVAPAEPPEVEVVFDNAIAFDLDTNLILGDTDGSALRAIAGRRTALDACLVGLADQIDAGLASSFFEVSGEGGHLTRLALMRAGDGQAQACVDRAIAGLAVPDRRYSGIVRLAPSRAEPLGEGHERVRWTTRAGGLSIELHAALERSGDEWNVRLHGTASPISDARSFAARPLFSNEEYSNAERETITRVGSFSHGEEPTADCRASGTSVPLEATTRTIARGGYVGVELFVLAGPCGQPLDTVAAGALHVHWLPGTERPYLRAVPRWRYNLEEDAVQRMYFESIGAL